MKEKELRSAQKTYQAFSLIYDAYVSQFKDDLEFYRNICNDGEHVLEIGCGTGRIIDFLVSIGCTVTGVDISDEMLQKAHEKLSTYVSNKKISLIHHDFSSDKLIGTYSRVLITFYTFNYIIEKPVKFLKNVNESVQQGTSIYLDLFYPKTLRDKEKDDQWIYTDFSYNGLEIKLRDLRKMRGNLEYRTQIFVLDGREIRTESVRKYYSPEEMNFILRKSGFRDIRFSSGYSNEWSDRLPDYDLTGKNFLVSAVKGQGN